jgi:hypothetical protein
MNPSKANDGIYGQVLHPTEGSEHVQIYPGNKRVRDSLLSDQAQAIHALQRRGSKRDQTVKYILNDSQQLTTPANLNLVKELLALPGVYTVEIDENGHSIVVTARKYEDSADLEVRVADCIAPYM